MEELEQKLLTMICEVCRIKGPIPDIDPQAPLIGPQSQLGIDSLDAVEIIYTVQKEYKVRINSEATGREILQSIDSLARFLRGSVVT